MQVTHALVGLSLLVGICELGNTAPNGIENQIARPSQAEMEKIDKYLEESLSGVVVKSQFFGPDGKTVSCVDITTQPALNHPSLGKAHTIQIEPSDQLKALLGGRIVKDDTPTPCALGTVEMVLPDRESIARKGSLRKALTKEVRGGRTSPNALGYYDETRHYYATRAFNVAAIAVQATFAIWKPIVNINDSSISQLWASGGSGSARQVIEFGYHVNYRFNGEYSPKYFVYYTPDNYGSGCYNECGFIKMGNTIDFGSSLPSSAIWRIHERTWAFYRDPATGNWYLFSRSDAGMSSGGTYTVAGYFPAALFGSGKLRTNADNVEFGGEVIYNYYLPPDFKWPPMTSTDMGNGNYGLTSCGVGCLQKNTWAAYQRSMLILPPSGAAYYLNGGYYNMPKEVCYNIHFETNSSLGNVIYFGGPGADPAHPACY